MLAIRLLYVSVPPPSCQHASENERIHIFAAGRRSTHRVVCGGESRVELARGELALLLEVRYLRLPRCKRHLGTYIFRPENQRLPLVRSSLLVSVPILSWQMIGFIYKWLKKWRFFGSCHRAAVMQREAFLSLSAPAAAARTPPPACAWPLLLRENGTFGVLSLCLSRACLGNMIGFA